MADDPIDDARGKAAGSDLAADLLRARVRAALQDVLDPELGLSVVELGLIYGIDVDRDGLRVRMTMTTPACPLADQVADEARARLAAEAGLGAVTVELVWKPPWNPARMSSAARTALGWGP